MTTYVMTHSASSPESLAANIKSLVMPPRPISEDDLPALLRDWLISHASRLGVPAESILAVFLTTAAAEVGTRAIFHPRRNDKNWKVSSACLWSLIIGRPGAKKTPLIATASSPFGSIELAEKKAYEVRQKENELLIMKHESFCRRLQRQLDQGEELSNEDQKSFLQAKKELEKLTQKPRRRIVQDATVQKLAEIIATNPNGVCLLLDEVYPWIRSLDAKGQENARGFMLTSHNGISTYTIDRLSREGNHIEKVFVTVTGGIQPELYKSLVQSAIKGIGADGFLQRFQLTVHLGNRTGKSEDFCIPSYTEEKIQEALVNIDKLLQPFTAHSPLQFHFTNDAQIAFDEWYSHHEESMQNSSVSEIYEGYLNKNPSTLVAMAGIFQILKESEKDLNQDAFTQAMYIDNESLTQARSLLELFRGHASYAYGQALADGETLGAVALQEKILSGHLTLPCSKRDVLRHGWRHLATSSALDKALFKLIELKILQIRKEQRTGNGRPTDIIELNPQQLN